MGEHEKSGQLPNLSILTLNQDHTNGTRPGVPTPRAMVADDDLALGRIVEGISKSRFWAHSLILVVEDDAQDGVDHVDGHRTVALAIGPNIRRGVVDSNNYNHTSMIRTIQEIFQIPSRTRFVKAARPMTSIFTAGADLKPYERLTPKVAIDEMNPPAEGLRGRRLCRAGPQRLTRPCPTKSRGPDAASQTKVRMAAKKLKRHKLNSLAAVASLCVLSLFVAIRLHGLLHSIMTGPLVRGRMNS